MKSGLTMTEVSMRSSVKVCSSGECSSGTGSGMTATGFTWLASSVATRKLGGD